MKSIIKEIFYGNRGQSENIKSSEEYQRLLGEFAKLYKKLEKQMSKEEKAEFVKLCNLQEEMESETADANFIEGVKIGILLGIEASN